MIIIDAIVFDLNRKILMLSKSYNNSISQFFNIRQYNITMHQVVDNTLEDPNQQVDMNIPQSVITEIFTSLSHPYNISQSITLDMSTLTNQLDLNEMIKKLLIDEKQDQMNAQEIQQQLNKIRFDFLVSDKLLRGNLKSHFIRYEISTETTIRIQYFIAFQEMEHHQSIKMNDWISAIDSLDFTGEAILQNMGVIVAMYDGTIRLQHTYPALPKNSSKLTIQAHQDPIKALKILPSPQQNIYYVITGGLSQQIKISTFNANKQTNSLWNIEGQNDHNGNILSIDINPVMDQHFCTAGSEGVLNIWKIPADFLELVPEVKLKNKKKKQANFKKIQFVAGEQFCHNQTIQTTKWATTSQIFAGCSDHTIKFIDVQKMSEIRSLLTKDSVTSALDYSPATNILVTSHQDGYIRGWDLRTGNTSPITTYKSHQRYVSCVQFCPKSPNIFASGSYDSKVNVWDFRSVFPLQTIKSQYDKVFSLHWVTAKNLVFGGSSPNFTSYLI